MQKLDYQSIENKISDLAEEPVFIEIEEGFRLDEDRGQEKLTRHFNLSNPCHTMIRFRGKQTNRTHAVCYYTSFEPNITYIRWLMVNNIVSENGVGRMVRKLVIKRISGDIYTNIQNDKVRRIAEEQGFEPVGTDSELDGMYRKLQSENHQ